MTGLPSAREADPGLSGAAWADSRRSTLIQFLATTAQLGLALFLLSSLEVAAGAGLSRILPLVFVGFIVHALLPQRLRLPFFLSLSFAAVGLVLGVGAGTTVVFAGLVLVGICHLPVAFYIRVLLLLIVASLLAAIHGDRLELPPLVLSAIGVTSLPRLVLPVLGSLFMFRLIIYMYDLRQEERARPGRVAAKPAGGPASIWERLSYFFLLPNVCFLLFPVIDFRTYRRTYYDSDALSIYQRGVGGICIGLAYLLAYRGVYHYLVPAFENVQGLWGVVRFVTSSYLVYLRVVGQFHIVIGILCLFGFNLPPAHSYYLFASSFTDFWRRTRIDWKDFMVKVFYYPLLVPLQRKLGPLVALAVATIWVFVATWLLHAYQWFWLRGDLRLSPADTVFWTIIGGCVLINSVIEARRARAPVSALAGFQPALVHAAKVIGLFIFMCLLWSYWTSPSLAIWWSVLTAASESGPRDYVILAAVIGLTVLAGAVLRQQVSIAGGPRVSRAKTAIRRDQGPMWLKPVGVMAVALSLLVLRLPALEAAAGEPLVTAATMLSTNQLNAVDQEREDRGYYEELMDRPQSTGALVSGGEKADNEETPSEQSPGAGRIDLLPEPTSKHADTLEFTK